MAICIMVCVKLVIAMGMLHNAMRSQDTAWTAPTTLLAPTVTHAYLVTMGTPPVVHLLTVSPVPALLIFLATTSVLPVT